MPGSENDSRSIASNRGPPSDFESICANVAPGVGAIAERLTSGRAELDAAMTVGPVAAL